MIKRQPKRMGDMGYMGEENDGSHRFTLPCMLGGDMV